LQPYTEESMTICYKSFRYNTRTWQTDGRTDRIAISISPSALLCWRANGDKNG